MVLSPSSTKLCSRDLPWCTWQPNGSLNLSHLSWAEVLFHVYLAAGEIGRLCPPRFWAIDSYWEVAANSPLNPSPTSNTAVLQGESGITYSEELVSQPSTPFTPPPAFLQTAPQYTGIEGRVGMSFKDLTTHSLLQGA